MGRYAIRRLIQLIPILIGITFLSFAMMRFSATMRTPHMLTRMISIPCFIN